MYCQVIKPHKSDFDFFKNLEFPLFRHNKKMGPYLLILGPFNEKNGKKRVRMGEKYL